MKTPCTLCTQRRAKRHCPGVARDICAICCAEGRETTIDCPRDCAHLREARKHEGLLEVAAGQLPHPDIRLTEEFVRKQEPVLLWLGHALARAMERSRAVDSDARQALQALVTTYRTRESGLIYESRPENPYAADLQDAMKGAIEELRRRSAEATGMNTLRDADVLGVLVFLERLGLTYNNGRRRGRVFYDFLLDHFPAAPPSRQVAV